MRTKTTEEQFAAQVENVNEVVNDVFAQFMSESVVDNSREAIIKQLLASGRAKRLNGLNVRNVVATTFDSDAGSHTLLTFVVKEWVVGDTRTGEVDAFDQPVIGLGKTHNVQSSSYAVAGVMKDVPKLAIFAKEMVDNPELANLLFAGGKLDIIMEFVPKDTDYVNPFATNPTPARFERDKVIHHIISVSLGEVGEDVYHARLMR